MRELPSDDARELYSFEPKEEQAVSQARKRALQQLISMRRDIDKLIKELSGDPKYKDFVQRELDHEPTSTRKVRNYDMPTQDAEEIAAKWGVDLEAPGDNEMPEWIQARLDRIAASPR